MREKSRFHSDLCAARSRNLKFGIGIVAENSCRKTHEGLTAAQGNSYAKIERDRKYTFSNGELNESSVDDG